MKCHNHETSNLLLIMKECEIELTQKGDMVARLQVKACQIGKLLQTLEHKSNTDEGRRAAAGQSHTKQRSDVAGPPIKKPYIDPIPPFNANKIRKSTSASLSETTKSTAVNTSTSSTVPKTDCDLNEEK